MRRAVAWLSGAVHCVRLFLTLLKGGVEVMVVVYVSLIIAGRRTYASVPAILKEQVKADLVELGFADLAQ